MFTDPILNQLIAKYPAPHFQDRSEYLYEDLIESIVSQQLSVKAADTIFGRFKALFQIPKGKTSLPVILSGSEESSTSDEYAPVYVRRCFTTFSMTKEFNNKIPNFVSK